MKKSSLVFLLICNFLVGSPSAQENSIPGNKYKDMKKVLVIGASGSLAKYVIETRCKR